MLERIVGLDVGDKWLGVALSDPMGIIARPLVVLQRREEISDAESVVELVNEYRAGKIVIGIPRLLTGHIGVQAEHVQRFAARLASMTDVPILFQDERFSTADAREIMKSNRKKKRGFFEKRDDSVAAAVILQDFLDQSRPASMI